MKGDIKVTVSSKKIRYELNLRRNITVIRGNSASGKTALVQIISDCLSGRAGPGTDVICDKKCAVLSGDTESAIIRLKLLSETVVFVDEQEKFLYSRAFSEAVLSSGCYFVFIARDDLNMLPYSVNEIYCLKNSGYYQNTRQIYNSMQQIYPERKPQTKLNPSVILTEDSNAGYEMFQAICKNIDVQCISAHGKSNISKYILANKNQPILAIVDGAAFGADMRSTMHSLELSQDSYVWTPESFEYLILQSGIVQSQGLKKIMETPGKYIESGIHHSWERYFTWLLEWLTKNTIYSYSKNKLNQNYLTRGNIKKIRKLLPFGLLHDS